MAEVKWGGKREGAGRPKGSTKEVIRKNRTLKALDNEWEVIKEVARFIKIDVENLEKTIDFIRKNTKK